MANSVTLIRNHRTWRLTRVYTVCSGLFFRILRAHYVNMPMQTAFSSLSYFYTPPHDSGGVLWFHVGRPCVCPPVIRPSVRISFSGDNLSQHKWIFTKLGICIDFRRIWFKIANGQISSNFDRVICPRYAHIFVSG